MKSPISEASANFSNVSPKFGVPIKTSNTVSKIKNVWKNNFCETPRSNRQHLLLRLHRDGFQKFNELLRSARQRYILYVPFGYIVVLDHSLELSLGDRPDIYRLLVFPCGTTMQPSTLPRHQQVGFFQLDYLLKSETKNYGLQVCLHLKPQ